MLGAVDNNVGSIWETGHAGHDTSGRLRQLVRN
jgi:hypothetical protein